MTRSIKSAEHKLRFAGIVCLAFVATTVDAAILRISTDGPGAEVLYTTSELRGVPSIALDVPGDHLYWSTGYSGGTIERSRLDGSGREIVFQSGTSRPTSVRAAGIALDPASDKVYWVDDSLKLIREGTISTGAFSTLLSLSYDARLDEIELAAGVARLFWQHNTYSNRGTLESKILTEPTVYDFETGFVSTLALDRSERRIYWVSGGALFSASYDFSEPTPEFTLSTRFVTAVVIDDSQSRIYWASSRPGSAYSRTVYGANLDGSDVSEIYSIGLQPRIASISDLAIDQTSGQLYIATRPVSLPPTMVLMAGPLIALLLGGPLLSFMRTGQWRRTFDSRV